MTVSAEEIESWLVGRISRASEVAPEDVDRLAPLTSHGLDSVALIALAADLEKWLGYRFRENPLDPHTTIQSLAHFLATELRKANPP